MGTGDETKCVFPLTSLQIGDLQSYLSDLSIFLGNKSKKIYILVDNRPWLNPGTRSAHFWQLMVTKSRLSPFANTKGRGEKKKQKLEEEEEKKPKETCSEPNNRKMKNLKKWFSLIDATTFSKNKLPAKKLQSSLYLNQQLHKTLYGFIVFEVEWANVRGINYVNELLTDTSLAIEAKLMRRWEFDSIDQAVTSMSQWFSGSKAEMSYLREYLDTTKGEVFHDAEEDFSKTFPVDDDNNLGSDNVSVEHDYSPCCSRSVFSVDHSTADYDENEPHTPPLTGPYKRRRVTKSISTGVEVDYMEETPKRKKNSFDHWESHVPDGENIIEATQYKDVLVLVRFGDRDLPFKLREVIMADIRLLTLLEAGLPSWVLFLQSYPGFCHLYRPWMCLLARALYVMVSVITVVIGFYDLYKNVPVLKATASRLCGPLFDWVETWDMVSRIKYLGTMLFLHNFQKAVKWALTMARAMQSFVSILIMPLVNPLLEVLGLLLPLWNSLAETVASLVSVVWIVIESGCNLIGDVVELVLLPILFIVSLVWNVTNSVLLPLFWILWEVLYAPIRVVAALANGLAFSCSYIFDVLGDLWRYMSSILELASDSQAAVKTYEVSMWRTLWNDLFSHVFRAVRSILNGFVAFFAACNRHRLSIYNHIQEFIQRLHGRTSRSESKDSKHGRSSKDIQRTGEDTTRRKLHLA
uniref:G1/S-specific cyclin-E protein n=1 Tax=Noccaea caerulescens TaxID=107243 RepID=A0A1J3FUC3_NOCCA